MSLTRVLQMMTSVLIQSWRMADVATRVTMFMVITTAAVLMVTYSTKEDSTVNLVNWFLIYIDVCVCVCVCVCEEMG